MHDVSMCEGEPWFGANDRYHLCRSRRAGQFGRVYEAWDEHEAMRVALKLIHAPGPGATFDEAKRLVEMTGDRVVKVFNADIFNDVPYLAMDFAPCGDLEGRVPPQGVPTSNAVCWLQCILSGVEACHRRRLVHRDIKPSNVLAFDEHDDIRLGDFGAAALADPHGHVPVHGDRRIVAPEGYSGGPLSFGSDVYSAAITGYFMLTGQWPTRSEVDGRLTDDITDECPHLPVRLLSILRRGWAHDPGERYETATLFREALANVTLPGYDWQPLASQEPDLRQWRGVHPVRETITVTAKTSASNVTIRAQHSGSGRSIRPLMRHATTRSTATELRKLFRHLDGAKALTPAAS